MMPAAAYHAGLDAETRERVQRAFQCGQLEVVVATIAFGMGIDKADIRTIIHAGLPGTLEGYYQEIGRAGRDGAPSRTFLMHSYADQRTHDFFHNRDYPPTDHLHQVFRMLGEDPRPIDDLRAASKLTEEEFDKALEKLEIHGGARVDFAGNATVGAPGWKKTYAIQAQHRAEQFEKVLRFTTSSECRMSALVRHFGDDADAARSCGVCDICDPASAILRMFRRATNAERAMAQSILDELRPIDYKATGSLQRSLDPSGRVTRDDFEALLAALCRANLIAIEDAEYEKDGEVKRYRKVRLTESGLQTRSIAHVELLLNDGIAEEFASTENQKRLRKISRRSAIPESTGTNRTTQRVARTHDEPQVLSEGGKALAARLKEWRTTEAKRLRVPAFCVMHDRTLAAVAFARPTNPRQLLEIDGIGPTKAEKFGPAILEICTS
jgi:superfamily II DNA helicase RecQ